MVAMVVLQDGRPGGTAEASERRLRGGRGRQPGCGDVPGVLRVYSAAQTGRRGVPVYPLHLSAGEIKGGVVMGKILILTDYMAYFNDPIRKTNLCLSECFRACLLITSCN